jgi:pantoate--beta-alanine ligase
MRKPEVVTTVAALRAKVRQWRAAGGAVALAPTMGALHAGHIALVELARSRCARVVVSIFVNPTQFGPGEDFSRYPRTLEADLVKLAGAGVDLVFHPSADEMYPDGFATSVSVDGPAVAGLEDRFRPTHFKGVATVVAKLLSQAQPDVAVFGEKDFQQLAVIRRMARDLDLPVEIVAAPTLREADGLAMSSRNVYLDERQRRFAAHLNQSMEWAARRVRDGEDRAEAVREAAASICGAGFVIDYLELRDAATLAPPRPDQPPAELRLLAAARMGQTRLIDNIAVGG